MASRERSGPIWVPVALVALSILTGVMMLVAVGVMFDLLPAWTPGLDKAGGVPLAMNKVLPLLSSTLGVVFVTTIMRRYMAKGGTHLLMWGIGLAFFATGSITEAIHGLFGWHTPIFQFWYLFGAVLIAAWMGQGTVYLLANRTFARATAVVLIAGSIYATVKMFTAEIEPRMSASAVEGVTTRAGHTELEVLTAAAALLRETALDEDRAIDRRRLSPLARNVMRAVTVQGSDIPDATLDTSAPGVNLEGSVEGRWVLLGDRDWIAAKGVELDGGARSADSPEAPEAWALHVAINGDYAAHIDLAEPVVFSGHVIVSPGVRGLTPFFNVYGIIWLIGGAIWSAWIFWWKGIMPNRALGNILIAGGAILGGGASAFARFGMLTYLYLAELTSLSLVFVGFLYATKSDAGPAPITATEPSEGP